jgi:hypothetical protein
VKFYISKGYNDNPGTSDFMPNAFYELMYPEEYKDALKIAKAKVEASILNESSKKPLAYASVNDYRDIVRSEFERFQSNSEYVDNEHYCFQTRRDYSIGHTLYKTNPSDSLIVYFNLYKTGILEGFKKYTQTLGNLNSTFILPLKDSRTEVVKNMSFKFKESMFSEIKNIYGVSINRLTYEFFEVIPNSDIWGVFLDEVYTEDGGDIVPNCEVYSFIDLSNNSTKFPVLLDSGEHYLTIPKHDYNLFDYQDEYSIRRFMDFIYSNKDNDKPKPLIYQSNEKNLDLTDKKLAKKSSFIKSKNKSVDKEVGFGQDAIDYKNNKEPKGVNYTLEAIERPEKQAKARKTYLKRQER